MNNANPTFGPRISRDNWLNTFVGILDTAFVLTEEEKTGVIAVVNELLVSLRVPDRGDPSSIPAPVAVEARSGHYSIALSNNTRGGIRSARPTEETDMVVSLETWREALVSMLVTAYPDMDPLEKLRATKVLGDTLAALGVPRRAANFFPTEVINTYLRMPDQVRSI